MSRGLKVGRVQMKISALLGRVAMKDWEDRWYES